MLAQQTIFWRGFKYFTRKHCSLFRVRTLKSDFSLDKVKAARIEEISKSPSGWVSPQYPVPSLPFQVRRSKTNNLPVYIDKKRGGSLVLTVIRNISGSLDEMVNVLKKHLGNHLHFQKNELTSQVKVKGYHKEDIVRLLKELGF
ncbi:39S ribosomal protein L49, mitochondrial-like [Xenia sp. Carnegie-2017]|uniref:39S ribosomal protein L49, mitochondrial-like n=1 Tax=Xenia sp. Carnegie-2017 TaxID=2897299 RepID=UPI001F033162|nr:39S ribosomal protein L49, mitochondrial-like [Xenia sp. Carnegie-2017]